MSFIIIFYSLSLDYIIIKINMECSICLQIYKDPRMLECKHTFCLECIRSVRNDQMIVICPWCRAEYVDINLNHLQRDYATLSAIEKYSSTISAAQTANPIAEPLIATKKEEEFKPKISNHSLIFQSSYMGFRFSPKKYFYRVLFLIQFFPSVIIIKLITGIYYYNADSNSHFIK